MKIPQGYGFDLTGGIVLGVVIDPGIAFQGKFLGLVDERTAKEKNVKIPCCCEDNSEFLLLQLVCPVAVYTTGSIVAINVANIQLIGPSEAFCDAL